MSSAPVRERWNRSRVTLLMTWSSSDVQRSAGRTSSSFWPSEVWFIQSKYFGRFLAPVGIPVHALIPALFLQHLVLRGYLEVGCRGFRSVQQGLPDMQPGELLQVFLLVYVHPGHGSGLVADKWGDVVDPGLVNVRQFLVRHDLSSIKTRKAGAPIDGISSARFMWAGITSGVIDAGGHRCPFSLSHGDFNQAG